MLHAGAEDSKYHASVRSLECVSLGNEALLRASSLATVLQKVGRVFISKKGTRKHWEQSFPVPEIDLFLSHNWCTPRVWKFAALAWRFNLKLAMLVTLGAQVVAVWLTWVGLLPVVSITPLVSKTESSFPTGVGCRLVCIPVLIFMLLAGGDMRRLLGWSGPRCFVDVTCINQTDMEIQKRAIGRLGAIVRSSSHMLVLATNTYTKRLWTVYELACFLCTHPVSQMQWLPLSVPQRLFVMLFVCGIWVTLNCLGELLVMELYIDGLMTLCLGPLLGLTFRRHARMNEDMSQQLANFSIEECACEKPQDRDMLYGNIGQLMRAATVAEADASAQECLDAFNDLVRKSLPALVRAAMGRHGFRYLDVVVIGTACFGGPLILDNSVGLRHGMPWWHFATLALLHLTLSFAVLPLSFALQARLSGLCLGVRRCWDFAFACGASWFCALLSWGLYAMLMALGREQLHGSGWATGLLLGLVVLLHLAALYSFRAEHLSSTLPQAHGLLLDLDAQPGHGPGLHAPCQEAHPSGGEPDKPKLRDWSDSLSVEELDEDWSL